MPGAARLVLKSHYHVLGCRIQVYSRGYTQNLAQRGDSAINFVHAVKKIDPGRDK
jgi:hypothetical protein